MGRPRLRTTLLILGAPIATGLSTAGGFAAYLNSLISGNVKHAPLMSPSISTSHAAASQG